MSLYDFEGLTRPLPEPHLLVEVPGRIVAANLAARRFFEREGAELMGAAFQDLVRTAGRGTPDFLASAASSGQLVPGRLSLVGRSGGPFFPVAAGALRPADGSDPALVLVRIDISDQGSPFVLLTRKIEELTAEVRRRMALEAERTELLARESRARAQAEEAARLKDDFIATISHELRTPLNAILGWASMLKDGDVSPEQEPIAIATIERAAQAQAQLVDDLLDFGRVVGGQLRLDIQEVDLPSVIEAALDTVRPAAEARGVPFEVVLDPRAGPVEGDPARLQQVVWNLLSNAIKFSSRGQRVQVRLDRIDSHVEIVVADQGRGISADFLPHVFDRFRQADATLSRAQGGVGLGLSIVRHLVEAHAGTIHAASEGPGKGATFTVALPLRVDQRSLPEAGRAEAPGRR